MVAKALIIDQPWISCILSGDKDWEMRSQRTHVRGRIGLIQKGTGTVVGVAELFDSLLPIETSKLPATYSRHRIPAELHNAPGYKWNYPWALRNITKLRDPVRYVHKSGAVIFVKLDSEVSRRILAQL